jgi:hypothetical protein
MLRRMGTVTRIGPNGSSRAPAPAPARSARGALAGTVLLAGVLVLAIGYWWWSAGGEGREIRELPPAQRHALYQRTIENLKTICDPAPGRSVREFCRNQARLALEFPECDDDCRTIARRHMSLPRR